MKNTPEVTTVLAVLAQYLSETKKKNPCLSAFFLSMFIAKSYGVSLSDNEFVIRLNNLLEQWEK